MAVSKEDLARWTRRFTLMGIAVAPQTRAELLRSKRPITLRQAEEGSDEELDIINDGRHGRLRTGGK